MINQMQLPVVWHTVFYINMFKKIDPFITVYLAIIFNSFFSFYILSADPFFSSQVTKVELIVKIILLCIPVFITKMLWKKHHLHSIKLANRTEHKVLRVLFTTGAIAVFFIIYLCLELLEVFNS